MTYVSTLAYNRGKFDPRAKPFVLLGYSDTQKRYKCLDLETRQIVISRDVHFHEDIFPFTSCSNDQESVFPISPQSFNTDESTDGNLHISNGEITNNFFPSSSSIIPSSPPNIYRTLSTIQHSPSSPVPTSPIHLQFSSSFSPPPPTRRTERVSRKLAYLDDYILVI